MQLDMTLTESGRVGTIKLNGYLDAGNAPGLDELVADAAQKYDHLVLDMEGLEYVSSAGLRVFKRAYLDMAKKKGTLSAKNVQGNVMDILEMTGFTRMFKLI